MSGINIDGVLLTGQQFAYDGIPLVSLCRLRVGVLLQIGNMGLSELKDHFRGLQEVVLLLAHLLQALNSIQ